MRKGILLIIFIVVLFLSFIPVIMGEYKKSITEDDVLTVILDAGHGGKDGGASSANGIVEKEITLSKKRKQQDLNKRVQIMNDHDNAIAVSIHVNAIANSKWKGAQTFYDPKKIENKQLATAIMGSMKTNLEGTTTREAKSISSLFILKNSNIPTTLVEIGFLSNPDEAALLNTEQYQNQVAYAIYEGILYYLDNPDMVVE